MSISLSVKTESWPILGNFTISRGTKTAADVVVVTLKDASYAGFGECVPYARYGETVESVCDIISDLTSDIANGMDRLALQDALPSGAARNALDCAFWDLEAKKGAKRVWEFQNMESPKNLITAYTLSLDTPEKMGLKAKESAHLPLLKLKLAGPDDLDRVAAVRKGAPHSRIIVDANEGWSVDTYLELAPKLIDLGVEMIEQPLPAGQDGVLAEIKRPVPICADESCHGVDSLSDIVGKYDMINIKLDKTGGLTEAFALKQAAEEAGLEIMVGCMLATSLAMAPAMLVAKGAKVVDLDGPLLLKKDRPDGIQFDDGLMSPPSRNLWG